MEGDDCMQYEEPVIEIIAIDRGDISTLNSGNPGTGEQTSYSQGVQNDFGPTLE